MCKFLEICYIDNNINLAWIVLILPFLCFYVFSCLTALVKTFSMMLSRNDERRYLCLVPSLRRKASSLSTLNMIPPEDFCRCLHQIQGVTILSTSNLLILFIMNRFHVFFKCFFFIYWCNYLIFFFISL